MAGNSTVWTGIVCPACPDGTHCSCTALGQKPGDDEAKCDCGPTCKCHPCTCSHVVNVGAGHPHACKCGNGCKCICTACTKI